MPQLRLVGMDTEDRDPLAPIPFEPRGEAAGRHPAELALERVQRCMDRLGRRIDEDASHDAERNISVVARFTRPPARWSRDDGPRAA